MPKKIVLAYSGGLDTSVILKWLQNKYSCQVVTFTADIGQGDDLSPIETIAKNLCVKEIFIEKVRIDHGFSREEFEMLPSSKIEEMLKDPILVRFMIENEKNMTLKEVEKAIKGWKK